MVWDCRVGGAFFLGGPPHIVYFVETHLIYVYLLLHVSVYIYVTMYYIYNSVINLKSKTNEVGGAKDLQRPLVQEVGSPPESLPQGSKIGA